MLLLDAFDFVINSVTEGIGLSFQPGLILSLEKPHFHFHLRPQNVQLLLRGKKKKCPECELEKKHAFVTAEKNNAFLAYVLYFHPHLVLR